MFWRKYFLVVFGLVIAGLSAYSLINARTQSAPAATVESKDPLKTSRRIVFLGATPTIKLAFDGFREKFDILSKTDKLETEYITLDIPFSNINIENAADSILENKVDLIVTGQSEIQILAKRITKIPIVSVLSSDPVKLGLAKSAEGSGNNVVFVETGTNENAGRRLEFFFELVPTAKKVLVIRGGGSLFSGNDLAMESMDIVARTHGATLIDKSFETRQELNHFFLSYDFSQVDAIFRYPGTFNAANMDLYFAFPDRVHKPIIVINRQELASGGLVAYGPRYKELGEVGATTAWQILKGQVDPGTVPILQPFRNELGINEAVAKKLGIAIPTSIRKKADYFLK